MKTSRIVSLLLVLAGLSACSIPDNARSGLRPLDDTTGLLAFSSGPFGQAASHRVMFADPSQREEYALFRSADRIAEVVYITTRHLHIRNLHLDSPLSLERIIETWNFTKGRSKADEESFWFDAGWTGMWVRPFALSATRQNCAAFRAEWDKPADDLDRQPGKTMFGYFCEAPGATLDKAAMESRLSELGIRGINIKRTGEIVDVAAVPETPNQTTLMSGVQQGTYGTADFPFIMARMYSTSESCVGTANCD